MTLSKSTRIHRYARPVIRHSSGRWFKWFLADSLHCQLTHPSIPCSGLVKGSEACKTEARNAARLYNETYVKPEAKAVPSSECKPSCARREEV